MRFTITMDKTFLRVLTGENSDCVAYVYVDVFLMDCPPGFQYPVLVASVSAIPCSATMVFSATLTIRVF